MMSYIRDERFSELMGAAERLDAVSGVEGLGDVLESDPVHYPLLEEFSGEDEGGWVETARLYCYTETHCVLRVRDTNPSTGEERPADWFLVDKDAVH